MALIQGSIDTEMKTDPAEVQQVHEQYLSLTDRAVHDYSGVDLVVWPETMFREPLRIYTPDMYPPAGEDWTKEEIDRRAEDLHLALSYMGDRFKVPLLLGNGHSRFLVPVTCVSTIQPCWSMPRVKYAIDTTKCIR